MASFLILDTVRLPRGRSYRGGRASGHRPDPSMLGGPTVQTFRVPKHQDGLPTSMTDAGESLWEPCVLRGVGGPPSPIFNFSGASGAADVAPTRWTTSGVNLRRVLRVGSWNVLSLSEDH